MLFNFYWLDKAYTVLIPSDNAFQRWHPIDWGFYPFSVTEFTESVLRNHFLQLKTPISMQDIRRTGEISKIKTLGGENITLKNRRKFLTIELELMWTLFQFLFINNLASPSVNNVTITSDHTLPDGSQVFLISEVLFVSEAVVSRLHQVNFHSNDWLNWIFILYFSSIDA